MCLFISYPPLFPRRGTRISSNKEFLKTNLRSRRSPRSHSNSMDAARMAPPSGPWTIRVDRRHAARRREIEATSVSTAWLARLNAAAGPRLRPDTRASSSSHFRCTDTTQRERERERACLSVTSVSRHIMRRSISFSIPPLRRSSLLNSSFLPSLSSPLLFPQSIFRSDLFKLVSPGQADLSRSTRH